MEINRYIDHTNLKAVATENEIITLCREAKEYNFFAVCVNSSYVPVAANELKGSGVKVASVVGFPLGAMSSRAKLFEAKQAVEAGADEIDMVINIGWLKEGNFGRAEQEIRDIKEVVGEKVVKVIFETCYLSEQEKREACRLSLRAGADFVKTSTGFGTGGATEEDLILMKEEVGDRAAVKAAGGIRDFETAVKFIDAGASRLGTSSGVLLVTEGRSKEGEY